MQLDSRPIGKPRRVSGNVLALFGGFVLLGAWLCHPETLWSIDGGAISTRQAASADRQQKAPRQVENDSKGMKWLPPRKAIQQKQG